MDKTFDIALLFFARSPYSDTKRKGFASNKLHKEVVSHLHFKTYQKLCNTGLQVIVSNEHTQKARSLSVNLSQAIFEVFEKGFQKIIVVGNDCPALNQVTLEKVIHSLREGESVLGPDMKGGNYLIGIDKSEFCEEAFEYALSVKSNVHENLSALLQSSDKPLFVLERKHDINCHNGLCKYLESSVEHGATYILLRRLYFSFIHCAKAHSGYILKCCAQVFSSDHSQRGPPICI